MTEDKNKDKTSPEGNPKKKNIDKRARKSQKYVNESNAHPKTRQNNRETTQ